VPIEFRYSVAERLSPDQFAEAQALAKEWAAKYNKE